VWGRGDDMWGKGIVEHKRGEIAAKRIQNANSGNDECNRGVFL
jgi:hypothetical protein